MSSMSGLFLVNFRREDFRRQRTNARRRAYGLGVRLAYFGVLALVMGLYGLNCSELRTRTRTLDRQLGRQRALHLAGAPWKPAPSEATLAEPWVADLARWRDVLARLPGLLPEGARLTSLRWNPEGVSGGERRLLLAGVLRVDSRRDRMAGVTDFVAVVARDSVFASQFKSVRLLSTRSLELSPDAEFELECR
jgi:hypothetical protein